MTAININAKAPVTCNKSIAIKASSERVWSVLTTINEWSRWQSDIKEAVIADPLNPGSAFDWVSGGARIHSTLHTVKPLRAIGWTGKGMGISATHNWTMDAHDGVVTVHVNESMDGFLSKLLKGYLNRSLDQSLSRWLMLLKQECER